MHDYFKNHSLDEHLAALVICLFCVPMVLRLLHLVQRSDGVARRAHLWLTILLLGSTVWAAQIKYIKVSTMGMAVEFDLLRVAASFVLAVSGTAIAVLVVHASRSLLVQAFCGVLFGLTATAVLIFGLTTPVMPVTLTVNPIGAVVISLTGMTLGGVAAILFNFKQISHGWKLGSLLIVLLILLPQHLHSLFSTSVPRSDFSPPLLGLAPDVTGVLAFATVAVCLLWALAAFVAEAHEASIRRALLRDATLVDPLTDLPNRLGLDQHLAALRGQGKRRYVHPAALLLFNIAGFKVINEKHGTSFGDFLLKEIASRLSLQTGPSFFVARLGADEFVFVINNVSEASVVQDFANQTLTLLEKPVSEGRIVLRPEIFVGYAMLPQDDASFDGLLVKSEVALMRAKKNSNGRVQRFDPEMNQQERERAAMLQELRNAAVNGQLTCKYQMQHDIESEELLGFEVLLRWRHPELGQVSPNLFIPLAERSGLIKPIGKWVLEQACKEAASWHRPLSVAVNVAPQQLLEPGFAKSVGKILDETGMPASRLELEITEASIIEDETKTLAAMHQLRGMGIRIAMDDFGTGYSSLAMLQKFPFDKIKIDRSFVIDVHENPERAAIIQATVLIGDAMSIPILVEGVENRDELTFLRRAKCNIIQGFIFGQPLSVEEARDLAVIPDEYRQIWY